MWGCARQTQKITVDEVGFSPHADQKSILRTPLFIPVFPMGIMIFADCRRLRKGTFPSSPPAPILYSCTIVFDHTFVHLFWQCLATNYVLHLSLLHASSRLVLLYCTWMLSNLRSAFPLYSASNRSPPLRRSRYGNACPYVEYLNRISSPDKKKLWKWEAVGEFHLSFVDIISPPPWTRNSAATEDRVPSCSSQLTLLRRRIRNNPRHLHSLPTPN